MKVNTGKEQVLFEDFHSEDLMKVIETQHRITEYSKEHKLKSTTILIVLDDIADDPKIAGYSKICDSLYVRGRHNGISVITSVHKFNALNTLIRVNATHLFFYKVSNFKEIELFPKELSTIPRRNNIQESKQVLYKLYEIATEQPRMFLDTNLLEKDRNRMFMIIFSHYLQIDD